MFQILDNSILLSRSCHHCLLSSPNFGATWDRQPVQEDDHEAHERPDSLRQHPPHAKRKYKEPPRIKHPLLEVKVLANCSYASLNLLIHVDTEILQNFLEMDFPSPCQYFSMQTFRENAEADKRIRRIWVCRFSSWSKQLSIDQFIHFSNDNTHFVRQHLHSILLEPWNCDQCFGACSSYDSWIICRAPWSRRIGHSSHCN